MRARHAELFDLAPKLRDHPKLFGEDRRGPLELRPFRRRALLDLGPAAAGYVRRPLSRRPGRELVRALGVLGSRIVATDVVAGLPASSSPLAPSPPQAASPRHAQQATMQAAKRTLGSFPTARSRARAASAARGARGSALRSVSVLVTASDSRALGARPADREVQLGVPRDRGRLGREACVAANRLPRLRRISLPSRATAFSSSSSADRVFSSKSSASSRCALGMPSCSISRRNSEIIRSCSARIGVARSSFASSDAIALLNPGQPLLNTCVDHFRRDLGAELVRALGVLGSRHRRARCRGRAPASSSPPAPSPPQAASPRHAQQATMQAANRTLSSFPSITPGKQGVVRLER